MGAFLSRAGHEVTLVDTVSDHVAAINRSGIGITGPIAEFSCAVPAFTPDALHGMWDTIILATKAHHTDTAVRALRPHLSDSGCVISAQNGLNELAIAAVVGEERTVGAFVNFGADYLEPGVILYGGRGTVTVGEAFMPDALGPTPRVLGIRDTWRDFDERAFATVNIFGYLWAKEAYGAMLFATALTNDSIADALARPEYRELYIALAGEILAVALARGVRPEAFDGFDPAAYLPDAPAGAASAVARRSCRPQPQVREDSQRHLARSRGPQAAHRGRCAAWHRRATGCGGRRTDTADGPGDHAGPGDRARRAPASTRKHGRAQLMNFDFTGRTAIVTGAAHGFGRAISVAFAERGANVWACDVIEDELQETQAALPGRRGRLHRANRGRDATRTSKWIAAS